jgi:hypothetical protein
MDATFYSLGHLDFSQFSEGWEKLLPDVLRWAFGGAVVWSIWGGMPVGAA